MNKNNRINKHQNFLNTSGSAEALLLDDEAAADEPARQESQDYAFDVVRGEAHVLLCHSAALFLLHGHLIGEFLRLMASRVVVDSKLSPGLRQASTQPADDLIVIAICSALWAMSAVRQDRQAGQNLNLNLRCMAYALCPSSTANAKIKW